MNKKVEFPRFHIKQLNPYQMKMNLIIFQKLFLVEKWLKKTEVHRL